MDAPRDARNAARWAPLAALAALTLLGLWLRLRTIPGPWGTDALAYVETALGMHGPGADTRSQRVVFVEMVRAALALGGGRPEAASWPGVAASACVGPVLFAAARRTAGPWLALVPAAIWAVLGLDVEEVAEVSADAATALPGALAALALVVAAGRDGGARLAALALGGVAIGAGFLVKETAAFAGVALVAGAFATAPGRRGLAGAAAAAGGAAAVLLVAAAAGALQSAHVVSSQMATIAPTVAWDAPGFLRRVTIGVPMMLLTATGAFGLLQVAALPLAVRTLFGAARGRVLAVAAVAGLLAFDLAPVSFERWAVLPAAFPRYVMPILPFWLLALTETLVVHPATGWERRAALVASIAGLVFVGGRPETWIVVPAGLAVTGWTAIADRCTSPSAASVRRAAALALVAGAACAFVTPLARTRPDPLWDAWPLLPRTGRVHADRVVGRRLTIAARTAPAGAADASRLRLLDDSLPAREALAPGDLVLVLRGSALASAADARDDLRPAGIDLGGTLVLRRAD